MNDLEKQQLEYIEKQIAFLQAIAIRTKRKHGIGIYCCRTSETSLGWHHNSNCKNWVLTY